jgi:hypothetical protein
LHRLSDELAKPADQLSLIRQTPVFCRRNSDQKVLRVILHDLTTFDAYRPINK